MALSSGTYAPRDPAASVLYQVVRDHYRTFRAEASQLREGEGLPRFVDDEFDAFLRCGWHAGGFARFRCTSCPRAHVRYRTLRPRRRQVPPNAGRT